MRDDELAKYLNLTPKEAAIAIPKLTASQRSVYERMAAFENELFLWENNLGPKPTGVLMDYQRKAFR